jgi:cell division protein FtsI/penicillin-binding protein 2
MEQREQSYRRILMILGIFFIFWVLLIIRLLGIQIWDHRVLAQSANSQRQAVLINNQLRGVFLDRYGNPLRSNAESWYLAIERSRFKLRDQSKLDIVLDAGWLAEFYQRPEMSYWVYSKPLEDYQVKILTQWNIPGLTMISGIHCSPKKQPLAWHILGTANRGQGFSGLEYLYNSILNQRDAKTEVFTINDGYHHAIPGLGLRTQSIKNKAAVVLTLDRRIQQNVEMVMDREHMKGAVVVLDAGSGDILAMASRPMVDLHNLTVSIQDDGTPFLNRAISAYHPGSIFKLVILTAGLESGMLNAGTEFYDAGFFEAGTRKWFCTSSAGSGHGRLTVADALAYSCNPVFIEMMIKLGPELVLDYADRFGLGQPCNIGLKDESWGEIPSNLDLTVGEQANIALGEGNIYTTPLQIASVIQTIANDGVRKIPRLVAGYTNRTGRVTSLPGQSGFRVIRSETARQIQAMMAKVVSIGTGTEAQTSGISMAGKTGTAQSGNEPSSPVHAWFAGFAPLDHPRYVVVIFSEHGVSGGKTAAPIFREIVERILK